MMCISSRKLGYFIVQIFALSWMLSASGMEPDQHRNSKSRLSCGERSCKMEKFWQYGCIYCRTGMEKSIVGSINENYECVEGISPMRIRCRTVESKIFLDKVQLLPRYIFFRTTDESLIRRLIRISGVYKLLEYDKGMWQLNGTDRTFAEFLFDNGLLQLSHATIIDGRLHFTDGIFEGHDDSVIRVNRRKKTAEVQLGIDKLSFWIGYDEQT